MRCALSLILLFLLGSLGAGRALDNPSFEVPGSGAFTFGGWEQFGYAASGMDAFHGQAAAVVSGQNTGAVNVSGFWQQLVCDPNEQFQITGHVLIASDAPLTGESLALLNVEWRNASGGMISYDSFAVADANSPVGQYLAFQRTSSPAPSGAVAMRVLLGVLQGASDPMPRISFDQITCYGSSLPSIDAVQWTDFPGGRSLDFAGYTWRVKGPGFYGPGPNNFSDLPQCVWVDDQQRLHMTISYLDNAWRSTEVTLTQALGYGDYIFTTVGAVDQLQVRTVLGLFLWQYSNVWDAEDSWWNPYNEFDIEYSRWGSAGNEIGQFVAQPWDWPGNIYRYGAEFGSTETSSHAIRWLADRVEGRAWHGGPTDESPTSLISSWVYTGPHIPRPEQPRVHINLWYFGGPPTALQEVVLSDFTFVPSGGSDVSDDVIPTPPNAILRQNYPNPFNPRTRIGFEIATATKVKLEIFDLRGRKITTLVDEIKQSGSHQVEWDAGTLPSGVYLCRLQAGTQVSVRKMVLMK